MKTWLIVIGIFIALGAGYYFLSPLFITVEADDVSPLAVKDNMKSMDAATKADFEKEVDGMKDVVKNMNSGMPTVAELLKQGIFQASAHEVAGNAKLIETSDGTVLRFENFETVNGPDLRIYLSADLSEDDFVELGKIKATKGNVNYDVPANVDTEKYHNVLVWCKPFGVLFSYAQLE